jgi:hypothetical protein
MLYFLLKLYNLQAAYILPSRPLKMTKFAIEIHQESMPAGALPRTSLGAHDAPRPQSGFSGTRWVVLMKRLGTPALDTLKQIR